MFFLCRIGRMEENRGQCEVELLSNGLGAINLQFRCGTLRKNSGELLQVMASHGKSPQFKNKLRNLLKKPCQIRVIVLRILPHQFFILLKYMAMYGLFFTHRSTGHLRAVGDGSSSVARAHGTSTEEQVHMGSTWSTFSNTSSKLFYRYLNLFPNISNPSCACEETQGYHGITLQRAWLIKHVGFIWNASSAEAESFITFLKHMMQSL